MARPARILGAAAALVVAAFLAWQLQAQWLLETARDDVATAPAGALDDDLRERALRDLRRAGARRPGTDALVLRAQVELRSGSHAAAARLAQDAVDREPQRFDAWVIVAAGLARSGDPAGARRALARARRLNPLYRPLRRPAARDADGP